MRDDAILALLEVSRQGYIGLGYNFKKISSHADIVLEVPNYNVLTAVFNDFIIFRFLL